MFFSNKYSIKNIRKHILGIDKKVPLVNGKKTTYINFDNSASTPTLVEVVNKVNEFLNWYSNVHRGTGYKSKISTQAYEQAREIVSDFVNCDLSKNSVIFVKNTTEAINKLSYRLNLNKDDIVLTSLMEHHSNDLPWRDKATVIYTNLLPDGRLDINDFKKKLKRYVGKVKLVTITGASNVTGYVNDIHTIASLSHKYGAKVMIDCAQLAPHRKINMKGNKDDDFIDFIAFSGHKMYAPFGIGVLIGPKSVFQNGNPEYVGGGTIVSVTKYNNYWAIPPEKEEAGTPNIVGAIALAEAIKVLDKIGMENIENHEKKLTECLIHNLNKLPETKVYSRTKNNHVEDMVGVISFNFKNIPHNLLAAMLSYEAGIGVRNGCFCAHPYVHNLLNLSNKEIVNLQKNLLMGKLEDIPGLVRVSLGMYNTIDEINTLINTLSTIKDNENELLKKYVFNSNLGEYVPKLVRKDGLN